MTVLPPATAEVERVRPVRPAAGLVALVAQRPVDAGERAERVGRELVAHRGGRRGRAAGPTARPCRPCAGRARGRGAPGSPCSVGVSDESSTSSARPPADAGPLVEVVPAVDDDAQHAGWRPRRARRSGPSSTGSRRCAARCRSPGGAASAPRPRTTRRTAPTARAARPAASRAPTRPWRRRRGPTRRRAPSATRASPPAITVYEPPVRDRVGPQHGGPRAEVGRADALRATAGRCRRRRASRRPSGPPDPTGSCPTHSHGSAVIRAASCSRSRWLSVQPRIVPTSVPRTVGRITSCSRRVSTCCSDLGSPHHHVGADAQREVLVEHRVGQPRQVREQRGVLQHRAAQRVDHAHRAGAHAPGPGRGRRAASPAAGPAGRTTRRRRGAAPRRPARGPRRRASRRGRRAPAGRSPRRAAGRASTPGRPGRTRSRCAVRR